MNYVLHPLVFADKQTHHEEKEMVMACLYTLDDNEFGLIESKKENRKKMKNIGFYNILYILFIEHLTFNLDNLDDKAAFIEVYVHKDDKGNWLFSPNNAAFQIYLSEPLSTFIILNVFQDKLGGYHMVLSWYLYQS